MPDETPAGMTFCYNELWSTNAEESKQFYAGLFGWSAAASPIGEGGVYHIFKHGEKDIAGLLQMPEAEDDGGTPPHWLSYVLVDDVDDCAARVTALGGAVKVPPSDIPGIGRFSVFSDPAGVPIGVFQNPSGE